MEQSGKIKIMVVDDNHDLAKTMVLLLKAIGFDAMCLHTGQDCLQHAPSYKPDVILMNIGMPFMDGYQLCRLVREQSWGERLPLIAVSAYSDQSFVQRSFEAGFDRHMVKPVEHEKLVQVISLLLKERRSQA